MSDSLSNGFLPQHARHIKPNLDATAIKLFNRAVVITESSLWAMSTRNAGGGLKYMLTAGQGRLQAIKEVVRRVQASCRNLPAAACPEMFMLD